MKQVQDEEVLEKINKNDLDHVILDIAMPGRGGLDILKEIKTQKPRLPVLMLSMYPEEQYAVRVLKSGASGYLTKESAPSERARLPRAGDWRPRPSVATLASAMDVGNPSNMERLRWMHPDWRTLAAQLNAQSIDDGRIRDRIRADFDAVGETWCPHTATAAEAYACMPEARRDERRWVLVATAHPAKFDEIVEPLLGTRVPVPPALAELLELPSRFTRIPASLAGFAAALGEDGPA